MSLKRLGPISWTRPSRWVLLSLTILVASTVGVWAVMTDQAIVEEVEDGAAEHADQDELLELVKAGKHRTAFNEAFELGDELFAVEFNAIDGSGGKVQGTERFTRTPRADREGNDEWAKHTPARATGPNAQACAECHNKGGEDGAGGIGSNVFRDPTYSKTPTQFIQRNAPHVFAIGAVQKLAEEMTDELMAAKAAATRQACATGTGTAPLVAKGVSFGSIQVVKTGGGTGSDCETTVDPNRIVGVDKDLIVRPLQWKGSVPFVRDFNRGAMHNEVGMQAVEITGDNVDGDYDGVKNELTVGDLTALTIYNAAQPRPTTKVELAALGLIAKLDRAEVAAIDRGRRVFNASGCNTCHVASLAIKDRIYREPSRSPHYRDATFPAGQNPVERGVDPRFPIRFDLTKDQPDNIIKDEHGRVKFRLGSLRSGPNGKGAVAELFGDLKRHDLGPGNAESIDEIGTGASTFLTENLWGVGSTGPYMHDGRATTLTEAILEHGGEGDASRTAFRALSLADKKALIAFLNNLVLFKMEEEEEEEGIAPIEVQSEEIEIEETE